jgi:hypothetical protein
MVRREDKEADDEMLKSMAGHGVGIYTKGSTTVDQRPHAKPRSDPFCAALPSFRHRACPEFD